MMATNDVIVIKDSDGHIYNVTADLLKLAHVTNEAHIELIKGLTSNPNLDGKPASKGCSFSIVGTFEIQDNKFLQPGVALGQTYTSPKIIIELGQALRIPPPS